jgi:hypothetical protein
VFTVTGSRFRCHSFFGYLNDTEEWKFYWRRLDRESLKVSRETLKSKGSDSPEVAKMVGTASSQGNRKDSVLAPVCVNARESGQRARKLDCGIEHDEGRRWPWEIFAGCGKDTP